MLEWAKKIGAERFSNKEQIFMEMPDCIDSMAWITHAENCSIQGMCVINKATSSSFLVLLLRRMFLVKNVTSKLRLHLVPIPAYLAVYVYKMLHSDLRFTSE